MKKPYSGMCTNELCDNCGKTVEVQSEGVTAGHLIDANCRICQGKLRHVFTSPNINRGTQPPPMATCPCQVAQKTREFVEKECRKKGLIPICSVNTVSSDGSITAHVKVEHNPEMN